VRQISINSPGKEVLSILFVALTTSRLNVFIGLETHNKGTPQDFKKLPDIKKIRL